MVVNLPVVTKTTFSCSKASQLEVYGKYIALCEYSLGPGGETILEMLSTCTDRQIL